MKSILKHINKGLLFLGIAFFYISCTSNSGENIATPKIINLEQFQQNYISKPNLQVINFWATWCKPCIEELPYFDKMRKKYQSQGVDFVLVSLDFADDFDSKLIPFLKENPQNIPVVLLDAGKPKYWIDKINKKWGGAIPATIITSNKLKNPFFKEGELSLSELDNAIQNQLNQLK